LNVTLPRLALLPVLALTATVLAACGSESRVCPEATDPARFLGTRELATAMASTPEPDQTPVQVDIGGQRMTVDKLVNGPLCNDHWRGTVYVSCGVRVAEWHDTPTFLKDCGLTIEPGTVIYVAAHNNTAYYQGCGCHTGEIAAP
jgi:hypothetical protein